VAPKPGPPVESLRANGGAGSQGHDATPHHREPANGSRKGLASLRRRQTVVTAPIRVIKGDADIADPGVDEDELSEQLEFLRETGVYGERREPDFPERTETAPAPPAPEPAVSEEPTLPEPIPSPVVEASVVAAAPAPAVEAEASTWHEPPATMFPTLDLSSLPKAKPKSPINLQRSESVVAPSAPPTVDEAPTEPQTTEPAPSLASSTVEAEAPVASASPPLPKWNWLKPRLKTTDSADEEEDRMVEPRPDEDQGDGQSGMAQSALPPVGAHRIADMDGLLVGEDEPFDLSGLELRHSRSRNSLARPLVDLDDDLSEIIPRQAESGEGAVVSPPPAPGPFPKWSALGGEAPGEAVAPLSAGPIEESVPALELPETHHAGTGNGAEASALPPILPATEELESVVSLADRPVSQPEWRGATPSPGAGAIPKPLVSGPVWAPPVDSPSRNSPWLPAAKAPILPAEEFPPAIPTGQEPDPSAAFGDAVAPVFQSPKFLTNEGNRSIPWKPPIPEDFAPTAKATVPGPVSDPTVEEVPARETGAIPSDTPPPPLFDLSSFGEGAPPRPSERVSAPAQRITLPQVSDSVGSGAKATVSTVVRAPASALQAPEISDEPVEVPVVAEVAPPPPPVAAAPSAVEAPVELASLRMPLSRPLPEPVELPESHTKSLFSARAEAVAVSLRPPEPEVAPAAAPPPPGEAEEVGLPPLKLNLRPRINPETPIEPPAPAAEPLPATPMTSLRLNRFENLLGDDPGEARIPEVPSKLAEKLAGREPETRPIEAPAPAANAVQEAQAGDEADADLEDQGMARLLGLVTKRPVANEPKPSATAAPEPLAEESVADEIVSVPTRPAVGSPAAQMPSVDDILSRPSPKALTKKDTLIDKAIDWTNASEGRRKALLIGGGVTGALLLLLLIGGLIFGGGDEPGQPGAAVAPEKSGEGNAAQPVAAPEGSDRPEPVKAQTNPLVLADGSEPGKAAPAADSGGKPAWSGPVGEPAKGANAAATQAASAVDPTGTPAVGAPGPSITAVAAATNLPGGNASASGTPDKGALVLPGVGETPSESTDPFTTEGSYSVIGAAGEGGAKPTGAPVATIDPDAALDRQEKKALSVDSLIDPGPSAAPAPPAPNEDDRLAPQRAAIEQFLAAKTWQERLPFIYEAEKIRPEIEAHYANHPDGPILGPDLQWFDMDEAPADGSDPFYAFYLSYEGAKGEFPVVVRETGGKYKVDWKLFVECKDQLFAAFRDSGDSGPKSFRLVMQRHSYWGKDRVTFKDLDSYHCFKIEPPYPGFETYVFLPKSSPESAKIDEIAAWGMPQVDVVLQLERKAFPHGEKHLVIKALEKPSWVAP
jgi:hypothetical protein